MKSDERCDEVKVKRSITLDEDVAAEAETLPYDSLSEAANAALRRELEVWRLGQVLDELDERHGAVDDDAVDEAERRWFAG